MIKLKQVRVEYQAGTPALQSTSLSFEAGKFNVLLGASGAGKSSLLRCVNLLVRPTTGSIEIAGLGNPLDRFSLLRQHRRNTAMVFQQHQLIGRLSVLQNVLVGRLGYYSSWRSLFPLPQADKYFALECLERVGLFEKALERVDNLSGGQQQRVGIARGLVQKPKIILADEPVASLDPATSHRVLSLLHRICKEDGLSAVVSLHQVEYAKKYADRIVGLAQGHVVFDGAPEQLDEEVCDHIYLARQTNGQDVKDPEFDSINDPATSSVAYASGDINYH